MDDIRIDDEVIVREAGRLARDRQFFYVLHCQFVLALEVLTDGARPFCEPRDGGFADDA